MTRETIRKKTVKFSKAPKEEKDPPRGRRRKYEQRRKRKGT